MVPPSLSYWYRRRKFADVSVVITDFWMVAGKPTILDIVPAHRLVLYEHSKFFQAKVSFGYPIAHNKLWDYLDELFSLDTLARARRASRGSHLCTYRTL
jgi:hypothetical protein